MPNYRRPDTTGSTVFFTVALARRGDDLLIRELPRLRSAFRQTLADRQFCMDAIVILPDHLHAIWTLPAGDGDYATRWAAIKARFVRDLPGAPTRRSHRARREKGIWQRRFWEHHIRDQADHAAHIRYCWSNPVKHGLVARPADWPYSSIHRDIRLGRVDPEWSTTAPDGDFGE